MADTSVGVFKVNAQLATQANPQRGMQAGPRGLADEPRDVQNAVRGVGPGLPRGCGCELTPSRRPGVPHHRARFTARGRWDVVRRVVELEETFAQAAAWANVSKSTVWEWVRRWHCACPEDRESLACLAERSSRPRCSPRQVPAEEARRICALRERTGWSPRRLADEPEVRRSHSTVHRVLWRGDCSRRPRPERPAVVRYEWPCPGNLLHMDTKKLGRFTEPGHKLTGDRRRRSRRVGSGRLGVPALDRRRLLPAGVLGDPR